MRFIFEECEVIRFVAVKFTVMEFCITVFSIMDVGKAITLSKNI